MHCAPRTRQVRQRVHDEVVKYISWCLNAAAEGIGPTRDFYGQELQGNSKRLAGARLCGGWKYLLCAWKGDCKSRKESHRFSAGSSCINCCDQCRATQPFPKADESLLYCDFSASANWRATVESEFSQQSPWRFVRGWSQSLIHWDDLHLLYLGIFRDCCGSLLHELVAEGRFGLGPRDVRLAAAWRDLRVWCRTHYLNLPKGSFTVASTHAQSEGGYATLNSTFKAADIKIISQWLSHKTVSIAHDGSRHQRVRSVVAWAMGEYIYLCDAYGQVLSESEADRLAFAGRAYITSFAFLAWESYTSGVKLWKIRPKLHYFDHQIDRVLKERLNPKHLACWIDETFMGRVKRVGQACHGATACLRILDRHLLFLKMRWKQRRELCRWILPG